MARLVPEGRQGEFFGFFIFSSKLASVVAPLTYGLVVQLTGSSVLAILSVTMFLVGGGALLLRVDVEKGLRQAASQSAS
jgi:UMF1 family MFS transporter